MTTEEGRKNSPPYVSYKTFGNFLHSKDEKPPVLPKLLKAPLIPLGIAVDTAVSPIFGVVGVIVAIAVASH